MLTEKPYDRQKAYEYAMTWALGRNPQYFNFTGSGGDCTNFISQCVYAGSGVMNENTSEGWYYHSPKHRAPSWTSVFYFYDFMINNKGRGPYARQIPAEAAEIGDVIQLGNENGVFYHALLVSGFIDHTILVCAHTDDSQNRRLDTYYYSVARFLHIQGVRH
ncbi:methylase [Clostridia bacterium]|nr:methylase [Clostridia bacterium]